MRKRIPFALRRIHTGDLVPCTAREMAEAPKAETRAVEFVCDACRARLRFRHGEIRNAHFAHLPGQDCALRRACNETIAHKLAVFSIAERVNGSVTGRMIVRRQRGHSLALALADLTAHIETPLRDYGRVDVLVSHRGAPLLCIDVSHTTRTPEGARPEPWCICASEPPFSTLPDGEDILIDDLRTPAPALLAPPSASPLAMLLCARKDHLAASRGAFWASQPEEIRDFREAAIRCRQRWSEAAALWIKTRIRRNTQRCRHIVVRLREWATTLATEMASPAFDEWEGEQPDHAARFRIELMRRHRCRLVHTDVIFPYWHDLFLGSIAGRYSAGPSLELTAQRSHERTRALGATHAFRPGTVRLRRLILDLAKLHTLSEDNIRAIVGEFWRPPWVSSFIEVLRPLLMGRILARRNRQLAQAAGLSQVELNSCV
jgi:hypothetical protein